MRVLILSYAYLPNVGGLENVAAFVTEGLHQRGHDVTVVTHDPRPADLPYSVLRRPNKAELLRASRSADVVLSHNATLAYGWAPVLTRTPVVCVSHGDYGFLGRTLRARGLRFLLRRSRRYAVSRYVANRLPQPCGILPNPVLLPLTDRPSRGEDLLFIGRLVEGKGAHVLLKALADPRLRNRTLHIAGDGPQKHELVSLAERLGITAQVVFHGTLDRRKLLDLMPLACLCVVPSVSTEGFPMVILETLSQGLAAIGSDIGGLPEAIGDCGLIVPPDDATALCEAILQVLHQPDMRRKWFEKAIRRLENHRPERVIDHYEQALLEAIA